jgi:hypothetical protein
MLGVLMYNTLYNTYINCRCDSPDEAVERIRALLEEMSDVRDNSIGAEQPTDTMLTVMEDYVKAVKHVIYNYLEGDEERYGHYIDSAMRRLDWAKHLA